MEDFEYERKKKKRIKRGSAAVIVVCVLCLMCGLAGGFLFARLNPHTLVLADTIYDELYHKITTNFLDTTESESPLSDRLLEGMVDGIGDIHSGYLTSDDADDFASSINGSFVGIGVSFSAIKYGGLVLEVFEGSPASKAGMLAGDIITHIEGTAIEGYTSDKVKNVILGEKGTYVNVKVLRDGKYYDYKIQRGTIESSAAHTIKEHNGKKVGYIRLTTFGNTTDQLVEAALKDFKNNNVENICIDLRGNGGGYLTSVVNLLDFFIPKGQLMFSVVYQGKSPVEYVAGNATKYTFEKGFVLVDEGSASSSEVMTSALSEILGYSVIGQTTYGKGTVQTQYSLSNGSTLKLTVGKWLTSKGTWINDKGITPNHVVERDLSTFTVDKMDSSYAYDQVDTTISNMQKMLKKVGYEIDREDGYFSLKTKSVLQSFEKDYGLEVNGIYEKKDALILLSAVAYDLYQESEDLEYLKVLELI